MRQERVRPIRQMYEMTWLHPVSIIVSQLVVGLANCVFITVGSAKAKGKAKNKGNGPR